MIVLGIDASTTTIGYAILKIEDGCAKLIACDHFKPPKKGSVFTKLEAVKTFVRFIIEKYKPDSIWIEEIAKFMPKMSSANTIIQLAVYNRFIGFNVYELTGKEPNMINVMAIRHKIKKNKNFPKKEEIPGLLEDILQIKFPYVLNKKGNIAPESYDRADALAVATYYFKVSGKK